MLYITLYDPFYTKKYSSRTRIIIIYKERFSIILLNITLLSLHNIKSYKSQYCEYKTSHITINCRVKCIVNVIIFIIFGKSTTLHRFICYQQLRRKYMRHTIQIAVAIMIKGGLVYERLNGQCAILNRVLQRLSIQL